MEHQDLQEQVVLVVQQEQVDLVVHRVALEQVDQQDLPEQVVLQEHLEHQLQFQEQLIPMLNSQVQPQ